VIEAARCFAGYKVFETNSGLWVLSQEGTIYPVTVGSSSVTLGTGVELAFDGMDVGFCGAMSGIRGGTPMGDYIEFVIPACAEGQSDYTELYYARIDLQSR